MKFKSKLATFFGALILAGSSFAAQEPPQACPAVSSIQAEGMANVAEILEGVYLSYNLSHYDTPSNWVFIIGPVMAESEEIALEESHRLLSLLSGSPTPTNDDEDSWVCQYETNNPELAALAIQADDMISPLKMNRYLRKAR